MVTITSIAGGAPKPVLDRLGPLYAARSGTCLNALYDTMSGLQARVAKMRVGEGEALDVLLMPVAMLDHYEKRGIVLAAGRAALANIGLGVGVKAGSPVPDIATPEALRRALLTAHTVVHAPPAATPSGAQSDKVLRELELIDQLPLILHKAGQAGGVAAIASGEAAIGIFPKSEIVAHPGVTLAGALPPTLQLNILYGAAVVAASPVAGAAAEFIRFMIEPDSRAVWIACGFDEPDATR
jgi:molybdate transport system substrate-binding protein